VSASSPARLTTRVSAGIHLAAAGIRALILDIEGATTPIAFVQEVLFPYARTHVRQHLERQLGEPECQSIVDLLRKEHAADKQAGTSPPPWGDAPHEAHVASIVRYVEWLMDRDRKSPGLKALQGRIWEEGYRSGEIVGSLFADVPPALERWYADRLEVGIFSSGSVQAQKLLLRHSSAGDVTPWVRWHFDTNVGAKTDLRSYSRIASVLQIHPHHVLFISDVTRELDAARAAGMQTVLSLRPGNTPPPDGHGYMTIHSFDDVR
jgi:2,3-diketo-5-methylthio-1-phosphopentane phosphatase